MTTKLPRGNRSSPEHDSPEAATCNVIPWLEGGPEAVYCCTSKRTSVPGATPTPFETHTCTGPVPEVGGKKSRTNEVILNVAPAGIEFRSKNTLMLFAGGVTSVPSVGRAVIWIVIGIDESDEPLPAIVNGIAEQRAVVVFASAHNMILPEVLELASAPVIFKAQSSRSSCGPSSLERKKAAALPEHGFDAAS